MHLLYESKKDKLALEPTSKHVLKARTRDSLYTLLDLEAVFEVQALPNETLYVEALGGGIFSNGIAVTQVVANDQGVATLSWVSRGDSTGPGVIRVHSNALNSLDFFVNVVKLELKKLPDAKSLKKLSPPNVTSPKINSSIKSNLNR